MLINVFVSIQSLPNTNPPVRNPTIPNTGSNSSPNNRMARSNRTGYNPPLYANERPQEEGRKTIY